MSWDSQDSPDMKPCLLSLGSCGSMLLLVDLYHPYVYPRVQVYIGRFCVVVFCYGQGLGLHLMSQLRGHSCQRWCEYLRLLMGFTQDHSMTGSLRK